MRHVLIPLAGLLVGTLAEAGPPEPTIRIRLASEKPIRIGPAPKLVSENGGGSALMLPDGSHVLGIEKATLVARSLPGGTPRDLGPAPAWFSGTPDSTRVVTMGPLGVHALAGDGGVEKPLEEANAPAPSRSVTGNTTAVATMPDGVVAIDLASGARTRLPIEPPADKRCHFGHGIPQQLSDDERWLLYQHGCVFHVMRTDGSKTRELGFAGAALVGTVVAGDLRPEGVKTDPTTLEVMELNTGARWTLDGVRLHPIHWRLPGTETLVMLDERGRLLRVELRAKKVTVLRDAMPRAVTADVRPDGRMLVVTRDDQEKTCGILELDPMTGKTRKLLDAAAIEQCFAHPTRAGAIVMAWRWQPPREVVLVELDAQGNGRQLGPAMNDIGNLSARGGRWVFQPQSKPGFLYTAP
jgi:hypothetical protein